LPNPLFKKSLTIDNTPTHEQNEVLMRLNFRTPVDYTNGEAGDMEFPEKSQPVETFSGLYKVLQVQNTIASGQFKQNLRAIRILNQNEKIAPNTENIIKEGDKSNSQNNEGSNNMGAR